MIQQIPSNASRWVLGIVGSCLLALLLVHGHAGAITALPTPPPQPGSYGLEATKKQAPPTTGAQITVPGDGASFSTSPTTVSGICPSELLVQVYDNGVMVGSVMCKGGSFSLQMSLFPGKNELTALVYDDLDQPGPNSNTVTVNYTDTNLAAFGQSMTLTSSYGRRSAQAGTQLDWPLQLSGGTGPYAFSIDWGDGGSPQLKSQALSGLITISHTYARAGIYSVNVKVTDTNGVSAFLQLVAVSSGQVDSTAGATPKTGSAAAQPKVLWIPTAVSFALLPLSYWFGRKSQVVSIRNRMLKERDEYEAK